MASNQVGTNLACRIGQNNIAMVVDRFYNLVQCHPTLSKPFSVVKNWPEYKVRVSYFWWAALGGSNIREGEFDAIPMQWATRFDGQLMKDWIVLFRQVVYSSLDRELAEEWMDHVEELGGTVLFPNEGWRLAEAENGINWERPGEAADFRFTVAEARWLSSKGIHSAGRTGEVIA